MNDSATTSEIARRCSVSVAAIAWHCRDPRGQLYGVAVMRFSHWEVPREAAEAFIASYKPQPGGRSPG